MKKRTAQDMIRPTHAYVGSCPDCKVATSSVYDMVDDRKFTADCVAKMVAKGLIVERVPLGSVELSVDGCACKATPATETMPLFATAA